MPPRFHDSAPANSAYTKWNGHWTCVLNVGFFPVFVKREIGSLLGIYGKSRSYIWAKPSNPYLSMGLSNLPWSPLTIIASTLHTLQWSEIYQKYAMNISLTFIHQVSVITLIAKRLQMTVSQKNLKALCGPCPHYTRHNQNNSRIFMYFLRPEKRFQERY